MAMARAKVIRKSESGNIIKLANGRFRIDCVDSFGKRHRPAFSTMVEAERALGQIAERKRSGEFLASAAAVTFDQALDLLLARNDREGLAKASRDRAKSVVRSHLRPVFGARKLSEFSDQRMRVARHGKLPPQRHEELPPPRIAEERVNEAGTNH